MPNDRRPKCPRCDSDQVIPIVYGYPVERTFHEAREGKIALGGCCPEDEKWHCKSCKNNW